MRALSGSTSSRRPAHGDIPWAARVLPVSRLGSYAERGTWRPPTTSRHEGESSRPPGGSPWAGLGGTRLWIERAIATSSACAGACCGRASCCSTSCDCCSWLKRRALASSIVSDFTGQSKGSHPTLRKRAYSQVRLEPIGLLRIPGQGQVVVPLGKRVRAVARP